MPGFALYSSFYFSFRAKLNCHLKELFIQLVFLWLPQFLIIGGLDRGIRWRVVGQQHAGADVEN